jgi:hypothetical protein
MTITLKYQYTKNLDKVSEINASYLVKFVHPEKEYPVKYTIAQDGTKSYEPTFLKGKDLTEKQIVDLFACQLL